MEEESIIKPIGELAQAVANTSALDLLFFVVYFPKYVEKIKVWEGNQVTNEEIP